MNLDDVKNRVGRIEGLAFDDESAHSEEDKLYRDVLLAIATGDVDGTPAALAKEALQTAAIEFSRWCA